MTIQDVMAVRNARLQIYYAKATGTPAEAIFRIVDRQEELELLSVLQSKIDAGQRKIIERYEHLLQSVERRIGSASQQSAWTDAMEAAEWIRKGLEENK